MRTDHERIGLALDLLAQGVYPFVEREMKAVYDGAWLDRAAAGFRTKGSTDENATLRWDAHTVLVVIWDQWHNVFRQRLSPEMRSVVGELREYRNRWAHHSPLDEDDCYRVLDSVQRLLKAARGAGVDDVEREKLDVLRNKFGREVNAQLAHERFRRRRLIDVVLFLVCAAAIVATTVIFIGPHNPLAAVILTLFVGFVFGYLILQRATAELPTYGVHECGKCRKVIYTEICPYCEAPPLRQRRPAAGAL